MRSKWIFVGIGTGKEGSFFRLAQTVTNGIYEDLADRLQIVGEINNQPYTALGENVSCKIPGLSRQVINLVSLQDLQEMAGDKTQHGVVGVAGGTRKARGIQVALERRMINVLITDRDAAAAVLDATVPRGRGAALGL